MPHAGEAGSQGLVHPRQLWWPRQQSPSLALWGHLSCRDVSSSQRDERGLLSLAPRGPGMAGAVLEAGVGDRGLDV